MNGLQPVIQHTIAVALIWLFGVITIWVGVVWAHRNLPEDKDVMKAAVIFFNTLTAICLAAVAFVWIFLYNPLERKADEMPYIRELHPKHVFVEPTAEQIESSNRKAVTRQETENEESAMKQNTEAMESSIDIFRNTKDAK